MSQLRVFVILTLFVSFSLLLITNTYCSPTLRIQSFGRIVSLGSLYDARTVNFIPGSSIFRRNFEIPPSAIQTTQVSGSQLHVHPLDSTYSKFNEEDFSRPMILSVLSEQLKVLGSWRYLVEEPKGQSIRYHTELKRKWKKSFDVQLIRMEDVHSHMRGDLVAMPHSVVHQFSAEELLSPKNLNATHFVVGITYGKSITGIFEDQSRMRKYGIAVTRDASDTEEIRITGEEGTHAHNIVRLYTDRPLHPGSINSRDDTDTPEELEQHFFQFDNEEDVGDQVPLLYDLIPLASVASFLNVNETTRSLLASRWGPQYYIGDPYIEPLTMVPIYKEFDDVSIARYRLTDAQDLLRDPEFEHLVQSRRKYLEKITVLQARFENSLEKFKSNLREILTLYRYGRLIHVSFEEAMEKTLINYQRDEFSLENVTKILDTQFQGLQVAICLEKVERTISNLYGGEVQHFNHLKNLGRVA